MPVATRTPVAHRPADRLPRTGSATSRGQEIRLGLLGVLGLISLVTGIPVALALLVGYPLPRHAPSHDWLTATVSASLIIKVLACVVWAVWAHFVVCLLAEWRAVRQGRLPTHVALGGGSQLLARRIVAAVLLLSGAATAFSHSDATSGPAPRPHAVVAQQHRQAPAPARPTGTADAAREATGRHATESANSAAASETKYYVVQPPHGRRYDSLWDIADRTLNDPLRYKEIFALNKDRTQSDGRKLIDANLIMPGWQLRLPDDATGPGVHLAHGAAPAEAAASHGVSAAEAAGAWLGKAAPAHGAGGAPSVPAAAPTVASRPSQNSPEAMLLGGALMLAGVLVALSARRGPYSVQSEEEAALGMAADPGLAALLDRALRNLSAARSAQGRRLPQPVAAWVSDERITLNLAAGDVDDPPAPWRPGAAARSWTCAVADIAELPIADVAAPFPGLLSVGRGDGHELFVDFEQAPGPISIGGDLEQGRQFACALAVQAATNLWSDGAHVTLIGFGDGAELSQLDPKAITQSSHLGNVLDDIERERADVLRLQRELGVDGVLTGRQTRRSGTWQPHLIVLSGPPTPEETARLHALANDRSNIIVVVVGDLISARWRFVVDAAGRLDLGLLGVATQAHRLNRAAVTRLADLCRQADQSRHDAASEVAAMTPHRAVAHLVTPAPSNDTGAPIAATVSLLGPVEVAAAGPLDGAKRELLTEIVVAIALHPEGVHGAVLRASIWPRGASDAVCAAALSDAAAWLGTDTSGRRCLVESEGRWYLSNAVRIDWHELRRLADAGGPADPAPLLDGISAFRGEAFSATPAGRYRWLAFAAAARDARVVGTAVTRRAAALLAEQHRAEEAERLLRRGLALVPESEVMWRDLLVLAGRNGPDDAAAVADEMYDVLRRHHTWPEPETDALVAQLAPSRTTTRTA